MRVGVRWPIQRQNDRMHSRTLRVAGSDLLPEPPAVKTWLLCSTQSDGHRHQKENTHQIHPLVLSLATMLCAQRPVLAARPARASTVVVNASWQKATTKSALSAAGGKLVAELGGQRVLIVEDAGEVFAVSNKCSHLGLPLQGKTALFTATIKDKCVVCPAHNTAFELASGEVKGEWCPKFPNLPLVGKLGDKKPLPTFKVRVSDGGDVEVDV
ncbi:MAG: Rieske [2Fe-2S] iron-sulfur domain-containing protein, partial [Monoraphidium minutum]